MTAIQYFKKDATKTFGNISTKHTEWDFDYTNKLIGLYGVVNDDEIVQLSFITFSASCPSFTEVDVYNWVSPNCFIANTGRVGSKAETTMTN